MTKYSIRPMSGHVQLYMYVNTSPYAGAYEYYTKGTVKLGHFNTWIAIL